MVTTDGGTAAVDAYLAALVHPLRDQIGLVRSAIMAGVDGLGEHVKWNAPSFVFAGEDRVTFRLKPRDQFQLVFHRGAKQRPEDGSFVDPSGLMVALGADRALVDLGEPTAAATELAAVVALVDAWVRFGTPA